MKSRLNFKRSESIKLSLFVVVLGLATIFSKPISDFLTQSYNNKIEFLANHTVKGENLIRY